MKGWLPCANISTKGSAQRARSLQPASVDAFFRCRSSIGVALWSSVYAHSYKSINPCQGSCCCRECFVLSVFGITSDSSQVWLLNPHFKAKTTWRIESLIQTAANHSKLIIYRRINGINLAQKVRTFVLGWTMLYGTKPYPVWKPVYFSLNGASVLKKTHLLVAATELSMWVMPMKTLSSANQLVLLLTLVWCYWMIEVWRNLTAHYFNQQESRLHVAEPYTATTSCLLLLLIASLVTHVWDGILFFYQHVSRVSRSGCVGHTGTNGTPMLSPQVLDGWGQDCRPLHSQTLASDEPGSVGARAVGAWVPMVAESHLDLCLHWDQDVAKLTWQWKAVMTGLVAALWEQRLTVCSLVWIVWVESRQLCHSANLDSKSVEDRLRFLSSDRVRKSTSCGLIFPACFWRLLFIKLGLQVGAGTTSVSK